MEVGPPGQLDIDMDVEEPEQGEVGEEHAQEVQSRTPVLLFGTEFYIDPQLAHYQQGLRLPIFSNVEPAIITDPHWDYAKHMAYLIIHMMYTYWPSYSKWLEIPVQVAREAFAPGQRHDSLGKWGRLSEVNERTGVPGDVSDEELLEHGRDRGEADDPTGDHALGRFRTNQIISKLVRGAIQLGYQRQHFMVENHLREGAEVDTSMVHSSCAALLSKLVAKVMGYRQYSVLTPRSNYSPNYILNIDPFGICQRTAPDNDGRLEYSDATEIRLQVDEGTSARTRKCLPRKCSATSSRWQRATTRTH